MAKDSGPSNDRRDRRDRDDQRGGVDWRSLHLWQIQPVRDVLLVLAIFGILYFGYLISVVTVPLLLALLFAYLFEPLVGRLSRHKHISRQGASAAIIVTAVVVLVVPATLGLAFAIVQGVDYARGFADNSTTLVASIEDPENDALRDALPGGAWRDIRDSVVEARAEEAERQRRLEERQRLEAESSEQATEGGDGSADGPQEGAQDTEQQGGDSADPEAINEDVDALDSSPFEDIEDNFRLTLYDGFRFVAGWMESNRESIRATAFDTGRTAIEVVVSTISRTGFVMFGAFLTAFFFFFISSRFDSVQAFFKELLPDEQEERILDLATKMDAVIAGFVRGRLTIALVQSVVFVVAYWLIGVPAPLVLGPIVGILSIVPYVALVGIPISILLLWLEPSAVAWQQEWWWVLGAPTGVYFLVQALDDYVLTPLIQGKSTNMETPFILFASLAGGALAGVYGLLLGIPVAACTKILITEVVWPRFEEWKRGKVKDPLPFGAKGDE